MRIKGRENEVLEFKESLAEIDDGGETICGFANQRGGTLYFGVKNNGDVLGIKDLNEKTIRDVTQKLIDNYDPKIYFSVTDEEVNNLNLIKISVKESSQPTHTYKGIPYIRVGSTTKRMSQDEYQKRLIHFKSINKDYSSNTLENTSINDLSSEAITELRNLLKNSGRYSVDIDKLSDEQLLKDLLLIREGQLTIAAIVLLGSEETISKILPYSEIRYGYRTGESEVRNQDMEIFRGGYLLFYKKIWEKINSRNINISIPYQLRLIEKKAFDSETIREAINNAIAHRDYLVTASIIIIQYPYKIIINSPGGFPNGITPENILTESKPRNKLIADILFKCDMVEQFGNGVNLMYKNQLSIGKLPPNYNSSDDNHVNLELDGKIQDEEFAKYVLAVAEEKGKELNDQELIVLNKIKAGQKLLPSTITDNLNDIGLIEKVGHNKYILAKKYYIDNNKQWEYTRRKGLSVYKNKEIILQHLNEFGECKKEEFIQLFNNSLNEGQIIFLLRSLKKEGKIAFSGKRRSKSGKWKLANI